MKSLFLILFSLIISPAVHAAEIPTEVEFETYRPGPDQHLVGAVDILFDKDDAFAKELIEVLFASTLMTIPPGLPNSRTSELVRIAGSPASELVNFHFLSDFSPDNYLKIQKGQVVLEGKTALALYEILRASPKANIQTNKVSVGSLHQLVCRADLKQPHCSISL